MVNQRSAAVLNSESIVRDLLKGAKPPKNTKIKLDWEEEDRAYMEGNLEKIEKKYNEEG